MRELVQYHSLLQAKKTLETEKPAYFHRKLVGESQREARYLTRQKVGGDMCHDALRLELTRKSWRWRVNHIWPQIPPHIRGISGNTKKIKGMYLE